MLLSCNVAHSRFLTALLHFGLMPCTSTAGPQSPGERTPSKVPLRPLPRLVQLWGFDDRFDAPSTDEVFIARPTNSVVLYSQMVGRGLRGPAIGGTASCRVVDVRDNILGFGDKTACTRVADHWDN